MTKHRFSVSRAGVLGTLAVLFVATVCVRLGVWQLDRRAERLALNGVIAERMALPALVAEDLSGDTTDLAYRVVDLAGEYDLAHGVVLAGRSHQGTPGVHLVVPFRLADGGAVLAHRGWLPALDAGVVDPADHIDAGPVRLRGLLLSFPDLGLSGSIASSKAVGAAGVEPGGSPPVGQFRRLWYRLDGAGIRRQLPYPTSALYLQVLPDSAPSPMAYPLALPLPELDAGPHLGYAVQWFIFAVVALGGWVVLLLRREGRGVDRRAGPGPGIGDPSVRASPEASR